MLIVANVHSAYANKVNQVIPTRTLVIEKVASDACALDLFVVGRMQTHLRLIAALPTVIEEWSLLLPLRRIRQPLSRSLVL
jgi:hypothetical protein